MKQSIAVGTFDSSCNPPRGSGAIEVVRGPTGTLIEVKPNDVGNDLSDFGVFKRWLAAQTVPDEEQFQHHLGHAITARGESKIRMIAVTRRAASKRWRILRRDG